MIDRAKDGEEVESELVRNARLDAAAIQRGVRDALIRHKALGESIAVWRDGRVVTIPAEEIVIPPEPAEEGTVDTANERNASDG